MKTASAHADQRKITAQGIRKLDRLTDEGRATPNSKSGVFSQSGETGSSGKVRLRDIEVTAPAGDGNSQMANTWTTCTATNIGGKINRQWNEIQTQ